MFRILIVEDDEKTLQQLKGLFTEEFPGSQIDTAETVTNGLKLIRMVEEANCIYDVTVLDFRLPQKQGDNDEVDESLCLAIRDRMRETLVCHITGHLTDPLVSGHIEKVHLGYSDPRAALISKLENVIWPSQLIGKIKAYLYGTRIEKQIDRLFGENKTSAVTAQRPAIRSSLNRNRGITQELATLCWEIQAHWHDLDKSLQQRVQTIFHVDTTSDPIKISLL